MEKVVLDDSGMFWLNGGFFPASSFSILPAWFGRTSGWGGIVKGAASVVVCTAIIMTARRYFRRHAHRKELTSGHTLPNGTGANHILSDRRRLVVTPSNSSRPSRVSRHRHLSSEVATVSFADSDSEAETDGPDLAGVPQLEVVPVVDDVGREADDESSEMEEDLLLRSNNNNDKESSPVSIIFSDSVHDEYEPALDMSEFCLTFESDSTISEPEATLFMENGEGEGSVKGGRIVMDLKSNGHVPTGFVDDKIKDESKEDERVADDVTGGSWVSLDDVRTSVVEDMEYSTSVVVTQAVVSLA